MSDMLGGVHLYSGEIVSRNLTLGYESDKQENDVPTCHNYEKSKRDPRV